MNSSRRMLVNKPVQSEAKLSATEKNIPASASAHKAVASVQHAQAHAAKMHDNSRSNAVAYSVSNIAGVAGGRRKVLVGKLQDKEYRDAYVRATLTHGLAHQIRVNREQRKLSQQSLAERCGGKTTQVVISRLEDPAYGKFTLNSILKVASALDVAVLVRLVPYSKFLLETTDKSVFGLYAKSFFEESLNNSQALVTFTAIEDSKLLSQSYVSIGTTKKPTDLHVVIKQPKQSLAECGYSYIKSK